MGGSGGGGSSGKVSYPAYMQTWHETWLTNVGSAMTTAQANSPFASAIAFNPATLIADSDNALEEFSDKINAYAPIAYWSSVIGTVNTGVEAVDEAIITDDIDAYNDLLEDKLNLEILPEYKGSMRTLGAVDSSSYAVGEAILRRGLLHDEAKYAAEIRMKFALQRNENIKSLSGELMQYTLGWLNGQQNLATSTIEANRIAIVAYKEQDEMDLEIDAKDALWDLETFQYGANMLGAIAGGTSLSGNKNNKTQSAIGGALSGAAAGATIGGPVGAAVGGVLGGLSGLF